MLRVLHEARNAARKVSAFVIARVLANCIDALRVCVAAKIKRYERACELKEFKFIHDALLRCVQCNA